MQELLFDLLIARTSDLTEHQRTVLALWVQGKTYQQIASELGINYTGVSHAIKGIWSPKHNRFHGGIEKKLMIICDKDSTIQELLSNMAKLKKNSNPILAKHLLIEYDPEGNWDVIDISDYK